VKLYHTTDAGKAILEKGFRDHSGSYGLENFTLTGVFVSDLILDINEGAIGDDVLELTLPGDFDLDSWEISEDDQRFREWCVPAEVLNRSPGG
jgi:hypothetical protein